MSQPTSQPPRPSKRPVLFMVAGLLLLAGSSYLMYFAIQNRSKPTPRPANTPAALLPPANGPKARGFVYRLTKGDKAFFLVGSMHMLTPEDHPLPAAYSQAFAASSVVVLELTRTSVTGTDFQKAVLAAGSLPFGKKLFEEIKPQTRQSLESWLNTTPSRDQLLRSLENARPWRAATVIAAYTSESSGMTRELGVDAYFTRQAELAGREIQGLETATEQLQSFSSLSPATETAMLDQALVESRDPLTDLADLLQVWRKGEESALLARTDRSFATFPEVKTAILDARNARWLPRLNALAETPPIEMVIVGAAHLPGPQGLLASFANSGWSVQQL